jgi:hypothetical protein
MGFLKWIAEVLADLVREGHNIEVQSRYHKHKDGSYGHDRYRINEDGTYKKVGHDNEPPLRSGYEK